MHAISTVLTRVLPALSLLLLAGCADDTSPADTANSTAAPSAAGAAESAGVQAERDGTDVDLAALEADVADLERRARLLRDVNAIERLQRSYGYYVDRADWDNVLDLLTDDATAEYGTSGVYAGKESIRELLYALGGGQAGLELGELNEHTQLQPVVDVAPDGMTAQGRWRGFALLGRYEEFAHWQDGVYENEYRKEDGTWKISKIHWVERYTVPFEGGLTTRLEPDEAGIELPPPDRPASFDYEPWPAVSVLPYHFPNPVTECEGAASC